MEERKIQPPEHGKHFPRLRLLRAFPDLADQPAPNSPDTPRELTVRIGRRLRGHSSLRELVVSHGKSGYVALYEYSPAASLVRVVAVRHQYEAGYRSV